MEPLDVNLVAILQGDLRAIDVNNNNGIVNNIVVNNPREQTLII